MGKKKASKRSASQKQAGAKALPRKKKQRQSSDGISQSVSDDTPVVVRSLRYGKEKVPSIPLSPELSELIYPIPPEQFLESFFRRRAVHVTCVEGKEKEHAERRVESLRQEMCGMNPSSIMKETSSDNIFLWLKDRESNEKSGHNLVKSVEISDVDTAIALHQAGGHAVYCRAPPRVEQSLVSSVLRGTGLGCGQYDPSCESMVTLARGEVETFISAREGLTDWHFDFQENFTIQLSGVKRWTIQQGTIKDPVRGCTPHYAAPEAVESQVKAGRLFDSKFRFGQPEKGVNALGDVDSVLLKPGDVFYFPAGMWHRVETVEPGISINVSLMASNYGNVTCKALEHLLQQEACWREPVMNNSSTNVVQKLKQLLSDLPKYIERLENHGAGADSIIPPVLQHPPRFELTENEEWEEMEEDASIGGKGSEEGDGHSASDSDSVEDGDAEGSSEADDEIAEEEVLDPLNCADLYPKGWDPYTDVKDGVSLSDIGLVRNHLALLVKLDEITSYYNGGSKSEANADNSTFVLNVNYAGNEMYESAVRVVFRDSETGFVEKLMASEDAGTLSEVLVSEADIPFVKFLRFHGFLATGNQI